MDKGAVDFCLLRAEGVCTETQPVRLELVDGALEDLDLALDRVVLVHDRLLELDEFLIYTFWPPAMTVFPS